VRQYSASSTPHVLPHRLQQSVQSLVHEHKARALEVEADEKSAAGEEHSVVEIRVEAQQHLQQRAGHNIDQWLLLPIVTNRDTKTSFLFLFRQTN
jgi:hypothetical protein